MESGITGSYHGKAESQHREVLDRIQLISLSGKEELLKEYEALARTVERKVATRVLKRCLDIAGSLTLIVLLTPLWLIVGVCVRFSSPGPILFRQKRVGFHGKLFDFLKFRSMRVNQQAFVNAEEVGKLQSEGLLFKKSADPRVTGIGKFIRRTSIDELPQLINVLLGEMSLIGPRPLVPFMLAPHPEFSRIRSLVRPGLTGLWQIRARRFNTRADYMVIHDIEYVRDFDIWLDLKILMRTLPSVIEGDGAH